MGDLIARLRAACILPGVPTAYEVGAARLHTEAADEITALRQEVERLKAASHWLPIDENTPRDGARILACGGALDEPDIVSYNERVGAWNATNFTLDDRDDESEGYNRPTHWKPLPTPPKQEGEAR